MIKLTTEQRAEVVRNNRERICFPIINRGKLWYDSLSQEEYIALQNWYQAWLDAPRTLKIPNTPDFVNKKVKFEEDIL